MNSKEEARQLRGDRGRAAASRILDAMHGSDFILSVMRAEKAATQSVETLEEMAMWVKRLQPYFDFDPEITVAQALQLYLSDRPRKTSRAKAGPAGPH